MEMVFILFLFKKERNFKQINTHKKDLYLKQNLSKELWKFAKLNLDSDNKPKN